MAFSVEREKITFNPSFQKGEDPAHYFLPIAMGAFLAHNWYEMSIFKYQKEIPVSHMFDALLMRSRCGVLYY